MRPVPADPKEEVAGGGRVQVGSARGSSVNGQGQRACARVSGLEGTAGRSPGVNLNMADGAVGQWAKEKRIAGDDDSQLNAGKENEIRSSTDNDAEDESDAHFPAPLSNGAYRKILKELPDGPRIATETCVKFWKEKKFPTEELVAFLKTISVHSPTLKKGFDDQHNGFLHAMKLQEEQQRKREEEEMARRHQVTWLPSYPAHMMMEGVWSQPGMSSMYMPIGGEVPCYPGGMSRHYAMSHGMYGSFASDYGGSECGPASAARHSRPYSSYMGGMRHSSHDSVSQDGMAHDQRMPHGSKPSTGLLRGPARGDHPSTAAMMMCGSGGSGGSGGSSSHSGMMWGDSSGGGLPLRRRRSELEEDNDDEQGLPAGAQRPRLDDAADQTSRGDRGACAPVLPVTDSDLASARSALKGKYPRDLLSHALGEWLTDRVHAITSAVFVKVVADVRRQVSEASKLCYDAEGSGGSSRQKEGQGGSETRWSNGGQVHYYRSKTVLAFRCLPGSVGDAVTFGMFVHEYGIDAPPALRGKVVLECIDGTPLFNGETPDERQRCLSAIAQGYIQFVGMEGFSQVLIRVPPPTDTHAHLFSPRPPEVQLKASQHLSQWYRRVMECGMRMGSLSEYQSSPNGKGIGFPLSILSNRDSAAEEAFHRMCLKMDKAASGASHRFAAIAGADRYFVADIRAPEGLQRDDEGLGYMGRDLPIIVCPLAASRHRFMRFCAQRGLFFHSIEHAQYSTMILLSEFLKQRQLAPGDTVTMSEDELDSKWEQQERQALQASERDREECEKRFYHSLAAQGGTAPGGAGGVGEGERAIKEEKPRIGRVAGDEERMGGADGLDCLEGTALIKSASTTRGEGGPNSGAALMDMRSINRQACPPGGCGGCDEGGNAVDEAGADQHPGLQDELPGEEEHEGHSAYRRRGDVMLQSPEHYGTGGLQELTGGA